MLQRLQKHCFTRQLHTGRQRAHIRRLANCSCPTTEFLSPVQHYCQAKQYLCSVQPLVSTALLPLTFVQILQLATVFHPNYLQATHVKSESKQLTTAQNSSGSEFYCRMFRRELVSQMFDRQSSQTVHTYSQSACRSTNTAFFKASTLSMTLPMHKLLLHASSIACTANKGDVSMYMQLIL